MMLTVSAFAYEKLQQGDKNDDVLAMQLALRSLGYSITADGSYGPATVNVVKSFQRKHNLTPDGVAGHQTLSLLYSLAPAFDPENNQNQNQAPTQPPMQNVTMTAYVSTGGGSLNLRFTADSNARVLATIPDGAQVTVSQKGNTWSYVLYGQLAGYVMTKFLVFSAPAPTQAPTQAPITTQAPLNPSGQMAVVTTTGGSLNLRAAARDNAKVLTTIPYGATIYVTTRGSIWCATTYNGYSGYVMTKFLTFTPTSVPTAAPTPLPTLAPTQAPTNPPATSGRIAYVSTTGGSLNLRAEAKSSGRVLTTIPNTTRLVITSYGSTWCATSYNGHYGYVMTSFLRFEAATQPTQAPTPLPTLSPTNPPAINSTTAYVRTSGGSLNLRAEAKSNARILTTIPNNTLISVTSRGTSWCGVYYNGYAGYVMTSFLQFNSASQPTATPSPSPTNPPASNPTSAYAMVTTSGGTLNLRQTDSTSARVLMNIPNGATVMVHSRGETWCRITYSGTTGYVMTKFLTFFSSTLPVPTQAPETEEEYDPSQYRRTLKKGMMGEDVRWVQNRLVSLGYDASTHGTYDDKTVSAVKAFQSQNGLTSDGVSGPQTFAILNSDNARRADDAPLSYTTLRIDDEKPGITPMQKALKNLGYHVTVNGYFDEQTHNAVVAFQQRNSLVISGIADALTQQVLYSTNAKPYSTPVEELPANAGMIAGPAVSDIQLLHWFNEIKPKVSTGQTITVFDPNTSLSWNIKFYSLGRHADSEPLTWRDTQIMNRSFGSTSWTIHPVYVLLPTGEWTMATMHNNPHLYGSITDNGFGGHLCIHFLRDMEEAQRNDPNYGVNNQKTLRNAWKALTGETVN